MLFAVFPIIDLPAQTSTGTIAIQVEDSNDHCPVLTTDTETICTTADSVIVAAQDDDSFPNGPPFHFSIVPEGTKSKWLVEHLNGKVECPDCIDDRKGILKSIQFGNS